MNKVVSTAPKHIWLDIGFDPQDETEVAFHELYDVTWSEDNASGYGIKYVRADITPPQREWNFCERCGKRIKDLTVIHTCTPPQEGK